MHIRCSFCHKRQEEVRRLIAGPNQVFICEKCVQLCREIIEEEEPAAPGTGIGPIVQRSKTRVFRRFAARYQRIYRQ